MPRLHIRHETRYVYQWPVAFSPQRLLIRPRDSHAVRLVEASLELSPWGDTRWTYDAMGNCVCWFTPEGEANELVITSRLVIDRFPAPLAPIEANDPHSAFPLIYEPHDYQILAPFIAPVTTDEAASFLAWLRSHRGEPDEQVLDFLGRFNRAIRDEFNYTERYEEGVQSPEETLQRRSGSCRDLAWLMVEGLRRLGFAAVFVTGYLYSPGANVRGAGATHAWCETFLPGLGWLEFDPTNGLVESSDLIRIAATRTPAEAAPVAGKVIGDPGNCTLSVSVDVALDEPPTAQAA
jgi:YD repeat-containing protein